MSMVNTNMRHLTIFFFRRSSSITSLTVSNHFIRRGSAILVPPIYRDDIFYEGDISKLAMEFEDDNNAERPSDAALTEYRRSVTSSVDMSELDIPSSNVNMVAKTNPMLSAFRFMLDFSFLSNPMFLLIALERFLMDMAIFFLLQFGPSLMTKNGLSPIQAGIVISAAGISNMIGRLTSGFLLDHPKLGVFRCLKVGNFMVAICLASYPFGKSMIYFMLVSCTYGYMSAFYIVSASSLYIELFGVKSLTSTLGLLSFFRGCGNAAGPVVVGCLYDAYQSYLPPSFICCGIVLTSLLVLNAVHKMHLRK